MTPAEKLILQNQAMIMGALAQVIAEISVTPGGRRVLDCLEESVKATSTFVLTSELINPAGAGKTAA